MKKEEPKKVNKKLFFTITVCVLLVIVFILLNSYALWKITEKQGGQNVLTTACLSIELANANNASGFTVNDSWPISDDEALTRDDNIYYFNIVNSCSNAANYQLVLESIETPDSSKHMDSQYIKVQLDDKAITRYSDLTDIDDDTSPNLGYTILDSKQLLIGTVPAAKNNTNGVVSHSIRLWISEDAPNETIEMQFNSKVKVYAGQGVPEPEIVYTPDNCFVMDSNTPGVLTALIASEECGRDIIIPATIGGVPVTKIGSRVVRYNTDFDSIDISKMSFLEEIDEYAFYDYYGENAELIIPNSVKTIGVGAFNDYKGTDLVIGDSVTSIGNGAFQSYIGYDDEELIIPSSVTYVGNSAFRYFLGKKLTLNEGLKTVDLGAFASYSGRGQTLKIPDTVTTIEDSAFASFGKYGDGTLILSNNINKIGATGFVNYPKDITIPKTIRFLGNTAFGSLEGDDTVTIKMSEEEFNSPDITKENYWKGYAQVVYDPD